MSQSRSSPIPIPHNSKASFAKPKISLKPKPKLNLKPKPKPKPKPPTNPKRKEIIDFIESTFCPSSLGRICDNVVRSFAIPDVDPDDPDLEPDEDKWGEMILAFNRKHIMETLSDPEIEFLYQTQTRIQNRQTSFPIRFMDEEEMHASIPPDYFIFNLKGELILACYR